MYSVMWKTKDKNFLIRLGSSTTCVSPLINNIQPLPYKNWVSPQILSHIKIIIFAILY